MKSSLLAIAALLVAGGSASAAPLRVVASFDVLADVVRNVGGDRIAVDSLIPSGADPHEFDPTPADARRLADADIVFVDGLGLEGWLDRLIAASGFSGPVVVASAGIATRDMEEEGDHSDHGGSAPDATAGPHLATDPHVWNSAANVGIWVDNIAKALEKADPADACVFAANAAAYGARVAALDAEVKSEIAAIPAERRKVLTSHDAFGYFGKEYGVEFLSPVGLSTDEEASAGDVARLIEQIRREHVKVYFFENSNDPRLVRQIADATGAEPGGELYVETLSPPDGPAASWLDMFRYNATQVVAALRK